MTRGYMVLLRENDQWSDAWDAEVHTTLQTGQASLKECRAAGYVCVLVELVEVAPPVSADEFFRLHKDHDTGWRHENGRLHSATCHDCRQQYAAPTDGAE